MNKTPSSSEGATAQPPALQRTPEQEESRKVHFQFLDNLNKAMKDERAAAKFKAPPPSIPSPPIAQQEAKATVRSPQWNLWTATVKTRKIHEGARRREFETPQRRTKANNSRTTKNSCSARIRRIIKERK